MPDFLDELAKNALRSVQEGFYETFLEKVFSPGSLKDAILKCKRAPVISEIKFASPSTGTLRKSFDIKRTARDMEEGGAVGISVLTEPKHFKGHIRFILEAREQVKVPILMKDIILSHAQIDAASRVGANAILLIQALFERDYCKED
ncbi:MAG: indole-3-glycerol-phosphate synthase, partial [Candidatus Bathyarchaeota archaeon]|nr:indole-3-glycerol-phosphate synthase [Candidatus Bathyarchaeota archaeon]